MKDLFLTAYFAGVATFFNKVLAEKSVKTVTFIPAASLHEVVTFYVDDAKQALEKMGLEVDVLDIASASCEHIAATLERNDIIYVSGGNTFYLLQELKRSKADELISKQIEKGKTYIGESAGAIILSPNISYIKTMDDSKAATELNTYEALNLVDFYPLPHYGNAPFEAVVDDIIAQYKDELALKPFSNAELLHVSGDNIKQHKLPGE